MANKINITAQLNAATKEGKLADAAQIYDEQAGKFQKEINAEMKEGLENLGTDLQESTKDLPQMREDVVTAKESIATLQENTKDLPQMREDVVTAKESIATLQENTKDLPQMREDISKAQEDVERTITAEDTEAVVESIEEGIVHNALRKTKQILSSSEKYQARHNISAITAEEAEKIAQDKIYETSVSAPDKLQAVKELSSWLEENPDNAATMNEKIGKNYADIQRLYRGTGIEEYSQFSDGNAYAVGTIVLYDGVPYKFTSEHVKGTAWDWNEVVAWSEKKEREENILKLGLNVYSKKIEDIVYNNVNRIHFNVLQPGKHSISIEWDIASAEATEAYLYYNDSSYEMVEIERGKKGRKTIIINTQKSLNSVSLYVSHIEGSDTSGYINFDITTFPDTLIEECKRDINKINSEIGLFTQAITVEYQPLRLDYPLLRGTIVENNGDSMVVFGSDTSFTNRINIYPGDKYSLTFDVNYAAASGIGNAVLLINSPFTQIEDKVSSLEEKLFTSINLLNKNAAGVALGKFIYQGALSPNESYNTTDYIPVTPSKKYSLIPKNETFSARNISFFNADRIWVSDVATSLEVTIPDNVYYLRASYPTSVWGRAQISEGEPQSYQSYNEQIKPSILETNPVILNLVNEVIGKEYKQNATVAFSQVLDGVILEQGTKITNKGIKLLLAKDSSLEGRIDIPTGDSIVLPYNITFFQTLDVVGEIFIKTKSTILHEGDTINGNSIKEATIDLEKLSFTTSKNLLDVNSPEVAVDKYVTIAGLVESSTYDTTGFVPVKEGKVYKLFSAEGEKYQLTARFAVFYTADKLPLGSLLTNVKEVSAPEGSAWLRVSYAKTIFNHRSYCQITEGSEAVPFQPFRLQIKEECLPSITSSNFNEDNFYLPKHIYVASGRTIELYYSQILLNYKNYNIQALCSIGASLERKFQIKGDDAHIGNYPLTITVYDDKGTIHKTASSTIHIVDASVSNMAILAIGDSLTNGKAWLAEVRNLSNDAISFVGTRKTGYGSSSAIRHEGRSGGTCLMYNSDFVPYTYKDGGYDGVGANAAAFDSSKSYAKGDFCKYEDAVYVFTSAHSGAWAASDVHNISESNPFLDWNSNEFSINHYKSFYGVSYDAIMIFLGTNGINLEPETNENGALGIKTLVENIRKEDSVSPIIVVNTIYRSGQNGIGIQGNTDGYTAQSEFKFNADRKVMLLARAVDAMIGSMENVYICPVGFTHDSEYNFGNIKKEVNPRLTGTSEVFELFPNDSVHPQLEGYLQMADEIFSNICAL